MPPVVSQGPEPTHACAGTDGSCANSAADQSRYIGETEKRGSNSSVVAVTGNEFATLSNIGAHRVSNSSPDWTDANVHDPGITTLELLAWTCESLSYRAGSRTGMLVGSGVVEGLAIHPQPEDGEPSVKVTQGSATDRDGKPIDP